MGISGSVYSRPAKFSTIIADADLDIGARAILTTNLSFFEASSDLLIVKNRAKTITKRIEAAVIYTSNLYVRFLLESVVNQGVTIDGLLIKDDQLQKLDAVKPFAIKKVKEKVCKEGLDNIETILSDGDTRLLDKSVDVVLFYGVLPEIEDKEAVLKELHRVLNPNGYLSTRYCFRMKKEKLLPIVEDTGLFSLKEQKGHILNFVPR